MSTYNRSKVTLPSGDVINFQDKVSGYTKNTGTVTSVSAGAGLAGGTITGSGTIKAKVKSETVSELYATDMGSTEGRQYAVGLDKQGYLSVNVPWTDNNTTYGVESGGGLKLTSNNFGINNSITAGTAGTSSATSGSTLSVPYVTYNAKGLITSSGTHTHTVTQNVAHCTLPAMTANSTAAVAVTVDSGRALKSTDCPIIDVYVDTAAHKSAYYQDWGHIYRANAGYNNSDVAVDNYIKFYSDGVITGGETIYIIY